MNLKKIVKYIAFIIVGIFVAAVFLTSTSFIQLAIAVLLYLPLTYFAFKLFPYQAERVTIEKPSLSPPPLKRIDTRPTTENLVLDLDKRAFLKLIGATGISFFLFSLLGRRAETLLFNRTTDTKIGQSNDSTGSITGSTGSLSTEGYKISDIDNGESTFYGFTKKDGSWLIMKEDPETGTFRYAKGEKNFSANWINRGGLKYDYYYKLF